MDANVIFTKIEEDFLFICNEMKPKTAIIIGFQYCEYLKPIKHFDIFLGYSFMRNWLQIFAILKTYYACYALRFFGWYDYLFFFDSIELNIANKSCFVNAVTLNSKFLQSGLYVLILSNMFSYNLSVNLV